MNKRNTIVRVSWFDQIKGIGEGLTNSGEVVFINSKNMVDQGVFKGLEKEEEIECVLSSNGNELVALEIKKKIIQVSDTSKKITVKFNEPVFLHLGNNSGFLDSIFLSASEIQVKRDPRLILGNSYEIDFSLPGNEDVIKATVVAKEDFHFEIRLEFVFLKASDRKLINHLLKNQ